MNRDDIVSISRKYYYSNSLTDSDYNIILLNYCLEMSKPYMESARFVLYLLLPQNYNLMMKCFLYALNYYHRKFTIFKLYSKPSPMTSLINDGRSLILIY